MTDLALPTGPIPHGWRTATLRDVTTKIGSGATPKGGAQVYVTNGTAFIRSQNVIDHRFNPAGLAFIDATAADALAGVTVNPGDVLLNITGDSILRSCVVPEGVLPARVSQHVAIIRSDGSVLPRILQKYLSLPAMKAYMLAHSAGGTRKAITKGHIESFPVPVPPPAEQPLLEELFELLDAQIGSSTSRAEIAERLLDALSASLDRNTAVELAQLAQADRQVVQPASLGSDPVDHFSIPAFDANRWPDRCPASEIMSGKFAITSLSILVSRLNPRTPRTWLAAPREVPALCSTEFLVLRPRRGLSVAALWLAVRDHRFVDELGRRASGTSGSHQRVTPDDALSATVPDTREADPQVITEAEGLLDAVLQARREAAAASALRAALLPELFTGRLRLRKGPGPERTEP